MAGLDKFQVLEPDRGSFPNSPATRARNCAQEPVEFVQLSDPQ